MDVGVAVRPERTALIPDDGVGEVVVGERPEQGTDPAKAAIGMLPPAPLAAAAMPGGERGRRRELAAQHGIGEWSGGIDRSAQALTKILRPQACGAGAAAARMTA